MPFISFLESQCEGSCPGRAHRGGYLEVEAGRDAGSDTCLARQAPYSWCGEQPETVERCLFRTDADLADPDSKNAEMQPVYAKNAWRSTEAPRSACTWVSVPTSAARRSSAARRGRPSSAFVTGPIFDLAGRVFKNKPAPDNLPVPPYRFETDNLIVIGEDEETRLAWRSLPGARGDYPSQNAGFVSSPGSMRACRSRRPSSTTPRSTTPRRT